MTREAPHHVGVPAGGQNVVVQLDDPPQLVAVVTHLLFEEITEVTEHLPATGSHALVHLDQASLDTNPASRPGRVLGQHLPASIGICRALLLARGFLRLQSIAWPGGGHVLRPVLDGTPGSARRDP
ncbi:hypothetical protein D3C76_1493360 [compost metagenome]